MSTQKIKVAASILSADMGRLAEQVAEAEAAGADVVHVDVMDGRFVPNITVGPMVVAAVRQATGLPLDVHLMILEPERYLPVFCDAGADSLTVHVEACSHLNRTVQQIKELGCRAGVSLNPATPAALLEEILPDADRVLVMTVNPGFGGQAFLASSLKKISRLRGMLDELTSPADLLVDGGINAETAPLVVRAGANVLVAGAAIFKAREGIAGGIQRLRASLVGETRNGQP